MTDGSGSTGIVREIGVNTWVWTSPLTTQHLGDLADRARRFGFGLLELPVENPDDWDPATAAEVLAGYGMGARIVGAMGPGRDLIDPLYRADTQDYLRHCVDVALAVGSPTVAGPFTAATGRVWRMDAGERSRVVETLREALRPVADYAAERSVTLRWNLSTGTRPASSIRSTKHLRHSTPCWIEASDWRWTAIT